MDALGDWIVSGGKVSTERIIAILGRKDEPTDAVEEYCIWLGAELAQHGFEFETHRVSWVREGWSEAKKNLRKKAGEWKGCWMLLQYTALSWSHHGFPFEAARVLQMIRKCGARCAVVFHDAMPYSGSRMVDKVRRICQVRIMRQLFDLAELAILTTPAEKLLWMPPQSSKAVFIPVGANLPPSTNGLCSRPRNAGDPPMVAVYCLTGGANALEETRDIALAVNRAAASIPRVRLLVLGRNALECRAELERGVDASRVLLETRGTLPAADVLTTLADADVMLYVRGALSNRNGSAIAGIASGLPLVAYAGFETAGPITEAGVELVPVGDHQALGAALEKILSDEPLRRSLAERSRRAHELYFAWPAIAARYAKALREPRTTRG